MTGALRRAASVVLVISAALAASAHVGTSNAYFEGNAGPYGIRVIVRTPEVIPGLAQVSVRVTSGGGIERVAVRPLRWDLGLEGAPPPDPARPVAGDPNLYSAELWLMTAGSYSVHVDVAGVAGAGTTFVPVLAVAQSRLDMNWAMGAGLFGAAAFLFVGALTVFGAAVRESVLPPGTRPDAGRRTRGRLATGIGGVVLALVCWGGWAWWDNVDAAYLARIYRPPHTVSEIATANGASRLTLTVDDPSWGGRTWTPLMPDHGKLMHMFLVKDGDLAAFAHVHPAPVDEASFAVMWPDVPPGDYRIYADIVHESGFTQTLVDRVRVSAAPPVAELATPDNGANGPALVRDPDDSWSTVRPLGTVSGDRYVLPSARTVRWDRDAAWVADMETSLRFEVTEADGTPSVLEPYMGMLSHAAMMRDDGSIFVHLHPSGSINMAAQMRFANAEGTDTHTTGAMRHVLEPKNRVSFPFVFPEPGAYRVFVQVKVGGGVETAAFDVDVRDG